jgi:hypothetical protein
MLFPRHVEHFFVTFQLGHAVGVAPRFLQQHPGSATQDSTDCSGDPSNGLDRYLEVPELLGYSLSVIPTIAVVLFSNAEAKA